MPESASIARQFEDLVHRLLEANGFEVEQVGQVGRDVGFDFKAAVGEEVWAIEVKYYRTARAQLSLVEAAASRLLTKALVAQAWKGMLVVSCLLPRPLRDSLNEQFALTFIDREDLFGWAAKAPQLVDELNALLESDPKATIEPPPQLPPVPFSSRRLVQSGPPEDTQGRELCAELKALPRGRAVWTKYEALCVRILKYLFPNDLRGWHSQLRTDDGLNRFDYVCRILPTTDFWKFLIEHLNSRYILFEFKNYTGKIAQGQILTTEKYLLERALRRVAIVFTRLGAHDDAVKMAQGAMRENGKLILIVDDETVCETLHMKERGEDPTDLLFELADDFLLSLPR